MSPVRRLEARVGVDDPVAPVLVALSAVPAKTEYAVGDLVVVSAVFTNAATGLVVVPGAVSSLVRSGSGAESSPDVATSDGFSISFALSVEGVWWYRLYTAGSDYQGVGEAFLRARPQRA